ncbi:MAG: DNA-binding protein [Campylobacterota bacterium]|nr:DNA-binding protein [Campylobacterota bacterium]
MSNAKNLSIFDFRAFLNLAMLLTESQKAKEVRSIILDIVIDTINKKAGGHTKYINQREENFLISSFEEENYRKVFTEALHKYVDMGPAKYAIYTNKIYKSIFKENANDYRKILKLSEKDKTRDTFYSEILNMISSYENGVAKIIKDKSDSLERKLTSKELDVLYKDFENTYEAVLAPHLHDSRRKMASRDLCFRDALHNELEEYIEDVSASDFEKFLGAKSKDLESRLEETKEVFKRLKDR